MTVFQFESRVTNVGVHVVPCDDPSFPAIPHSILRTLSLNSKFIPTPQWSERRTVDTFNQALDSFIRRIRLTDFFGTDSDPPPRFYVSTGWQPDTTPPTIQRIIDELRSLHNVLTLTPSSHQSNVSPTRLKKLLTFQRSHPSVLIRNCDKNLGIALISRRWYTSTVLSMLSDQSTYQRITWKNQAIAVMRRARKRVLQIIGSFFNDDLVPPPFIKYILKGLDSDVERLPVFHGIVKLHKSPIALRPIVAGHTTVLSNYCRVLAHYLQPLVELSPRWIKNSTHLLSKLLSLHCPRPHDNTRTWLVTGDVASLYTNISIDLAAEVLTRMLEDYEHVYQSSLSPLSPSNILGLVKIALDSNVFTFREDLETEHFFRQIDGLAMGNPLAPLIANLVMDSLEESLTTPPGLNLLLWSRYIDDIFFVAHGTLQQVHSFCDAYNRLHPKINITWDVSSSQAEFLDLAITLDDNRLQTATHQKALNAYLYIPANSFHSRSMKVSFIKSELRRYATNSSTVGAFRQTQHAFFLRLRARGYTPLFLRKIFDQVHYVPPSQRPSFTLQPRQLSQPPIVLKLPYIPAFQRLTMGVLLTLTPNLKSWLHNHPNARALIAWTRSRNFADLVLSSDHTRSLPPS